MSKSAIAPFDRAFIRAPDHQRSGELRLGLDHGSGLGAVRDRLERTLEQRDDGNLAVLRKLDAALKRQRMENSQLIAALAAERLDRASVAHRDVVIVRVGCRLN